MLLYRPDFDEHSHNERVKESGGFAVTAISKKTKIGVNDLQLAVNKTVGIPASLGVHLGRGFSKFGLNSLECTMLGNDAFTEVYFTTESGNVYKIYKLKDAFDHPSTSWVLANVRDNKGKKQVIGYRFPKPEISQRTLEVGRPFHYGLTGVTSEVVAILCVNASRCYLPEKQTDCTSDIRAEFERMIA